MPRSSRKGNRKTSAIDISDFSNLSVHHASTLPLPSKLKTTPCKVSEICIDETNIEKSIENDGNAITFFVCVHNLHYKIIEVKLFLFITF